MEPKEPKRNMRAAIMAALGLSETEYGMKQFECGMEYLEEHCSKADVQRLAKDIDFWSWWRMSWEARDLVLIVQLEREIVEKKEAKDLWEAMHEPNAVIDKVPNFIDRRRVSAP